MGAAAAVAATGQEIPDTMRHKIQSYLDARIRSYAQNKRYRSEVLKAMMGPGLRTDHRKYPHQEKRRTAFSHRGGGHRSVRGSPSTSSGRRNRPIHR